jgi:hypothetical protein
VIDGTISHADIPDDPCTESERRQIFFAAAIGVPTVFIRADTKNLVLRRIIAQVAQQRLSRRYKGYLRVEVAAYQLACLEVLRRECGTIPGNEGAADIFDRLEAMLRGAKPTAAAQLTGAILDKHGRGSDPMRLKAGDFNRAAETYYRTDLCRLHVTDGLETLIDDGKRIDACADPAIGALKERLTGSAPAALFIREAGSRLLAGEATDREIHVLILLTLLIVHREGGGDSGN